MAVKAKKPRTAKKKAEKAKPEANGSEPLADKALKQTFLPGTEPEIIPEVEDAANEFQEARIAKRTANEILHDKALLLLSRMIENGLSSYENEEGMVFNINEVKAIKAKKKKKAKHPVTGEA